RGRGPGMPEAGIKGLRREGVERSAEDDDISADEEAGGFAKEVSAGDGGAAGMALFDRRGEFLDGLERNIVSRLDAMVEEIGEQIAATGAHVEQSLAGEVIETGEGGESNALGVPAGPEERPKAAAMGAGG